jgi:hypothetical protein
MIMAITNHRIKNKKTQRGRAAIKQEKELIAHPAAAGEQLTEF